MVSVFHKNITDSKWISSTYNTLVAQRHWLTISDFQVITSILGPDRALWAFLSQMPQPPNSETIKLQLLFENLYFNKTKMIFIPCQPHARTSLTAWIPKFKSRPLIYQISPVCDKSDIWQFPVIPYLREAFNQSKTGWNVSRIPYRWSRLDQKWFITKLLSWSGSKSKLHTQQNR